MEPTTTDEQDSCGFDLVLKELIEFRNEANQSMDSNRFERVLRELMAEREKAAIAADRNRQQSELMAEREKAMAEREKAAVATAILKQQEEFQLKLQRQQETFQAKIEEERREHSTKHDKLLARQDELLLCQEEEKKEERRRQDQERRDALQQQERQQNYFQDVIQQLQDEVKVLRHSEGARFISGTQQGEVETPGKHRTTDSSSPYSMTPLSLMMETPNKPFEDSIGSEVVENFAAGESGSVDQTNNYVENDAVEEEEPTSIIKSDQGSVVSDGIQRAKGRVTFEEKSLLNKSGQVGNKVENEKGKKPPQQIIASSKIRIRKESKEKMQMIGGKQKLIVMLICEEMDIVGQ